MIERSHAAAGLLALAAACSAPEDSAPPPAKADEQRALADARAMIPADQIDPRPPPQETPTP